MTTRRVYGFRRRNLTGHRYQDGIGAQAKSDAPVVIESKDIGTITADEEEIIEVKPAASLITNTPETAPEKYTEPDAVPEPEEPEDLPKVATLTDDNEDTGPLPKHMTGFMPLSAKASETTPEETVEEEEPEL